MGAAPHTQSVSAARRPADPTAAILTAAEAVLVADSLIPPAAPRVHADATAALAALLYAASGVGNGDGIDWVLEAHTNVDTSDTSAAGWAQAWSRCATIPVLRLGVKAVLIGGDEHQGAVLAAISEALGPWRSRCG